MHVRTVVLVTIAILMAVLPACSTAPADKSALMKEVEMATSHSVSEC